MSDSGRDAGRASGGNAGPRVDSSVAHAARVYDYWLGGKDNYAADREAAEHAAAAYPEIMRGVREQRAFLARAVSYLAGEVGIRQFLDIGTGLPAANNTHEVAQRVAPDARVVYVDNDPIVLAHARALLTGEPEGVTDYLDADLRATPTILSHAARSLDLRRPVAVMLVGILQLIPDEDGPRQIVATLMDAVPPGSWLAIAHPTPDIQTDQITELAARLNRLMSQATTLRSREDVTAFFDGLDLILPGVVPLNRWRPGRAGLGSGPDVAAYCGLARKP